MTAFVLIVWFYVSTGGYSNGNAVAFQEFASKDSCEDALRDIYKLTNGVSGMCVPK